MLVLQHIWSHWTKRSRPALAARPRLEDAYPLKLRSAPSTAWLHDVRCLEREDFQLIERAEPFTAQAWEYAVPAHAANLSIRMQGTDVLVSLREPWPSMRRTAWPAHLPDPVSILRPDEVIVLDWNARFSRSAGGADRGYFYAQHRYWLANTICPEPCLFTDAVPKKHLDFRTSIY